MVADLILFQILFRPSTCSFLDSTLCTHIDLFPGPGYAPATAACPPFQASSCLTEKLSSSILCILTNLFPPYCYSLPSCKLARNLPQPHLQVVHLRFQPHSPQKGFPCDTLYFLPRYFIPVSPNPWLLHERERSPTIHFPEPSSFYILSNFSWPSPKKTVQAFLINLRNYRTSSDEAFS